eukprot:tig00001085_g6965.t1
MEIVVPSNSHHWPPQAGHGGVSHFDMVSLGAPPTNPGMLKDASGFFPRGAGMLPSVHSLLNGSPTSEAAPLPRPALSSGERSPATPQESRAPTPTHERSKSDELRFEPPVRRPALPKRGGAWGPEGRRPGSASPVSSHAPSPLPGAPSPAVPAAHPRRRPGGIGGGAGAAAGDVGGVPAVRGGGPLVLLIAASAALDGLPSPSAPRPAPRPPLPDRPQERAAGLARQRAPAPYRGCCRGRPVRGAGGEAAREGGSESEDEGAAPGRRRRPAGAAAGSASSEEGAGEAEEEEDDEDIFRRAARPRPRPGASRRRPDAPGPDRFRPESVIGMSAGALRVRMLACSDGELECFTSKQINKVIAKLGGEDESYRHLSKPVYIQKLRRLLEALRRGEAPAASPPGSPSSAASSPHPVDEEAE